MYLEQLTCLQDHRSFLEKEKGDVFFGRRLAGQHPGDKCTQCWDPGAHFLWD